MAADRIPDAAVQAAAEVMLRQYDSQYGSDNITWRDFADDARVILTAALGTLNSSTHWGVACGGEFPDHATVLEYDDQADAQENLQWFTAGCVVRREVFGTPWERVEATDA